MQSENIIVVKSSGLCHTVAACDSGPERVGLNHFWYPGTRCLFYSASQIRMFCIPEAELIRKRERLLGLSSRAGLSFLYFQTCRPIGTTSVWSQAVQSNLLHQGGWLSATSEEETPGDPLSTCLHSRERVQVNSQGPGHPRHPALPRSVAPEQTSQYSIECPETFKTTTVTL